MKLQKRVMMLVSVLLLGIVLVACGGDKLTSIEITGVDNIEVEAGASFNVLDGVKATGDDGKDYTDKITVTSTSAALNRETGVLNTETPGDVMIRYEVRVESGDEVILAQPWRTVTVLRPPREDDELIGKGVSYWDKYENAGGTIDLTEEEDGTFKLVITAGQETHEPRISQMGVPFEKDKTYRVSFEAKALDEKTINLQAGQLLDAAPWFVEFHKGQMERRTITTDWESFEFFFKHTIENKDGGILFEFGPVLGNSVDTTMWLKNIDVEEAEEQEDTVAPMLSGIEDGSVQLDSEFDPLSGVVAQDNIDGDISDKIEVVSITKDEVKVDKVDTSIDGAVYVITYKVADAAGNETEEERTITIRDFEAEFGNVITNGDFKDGLNGWEFYASQGDGADIEVSVVSEEAVIDVKALGNNPWDNQFTQEGFSLENNATYKLSFTVRAETARLMNVALGVALDADPWFVEYIPKIEGIELTTTNQSFSYTFRIEKDSTPIAKLAFELGNIGTSVIGKVFISDVVLEKVLFIDDFTEEGYEFGTGDDAETVHGHIIENSGDVVFATAEREANKLTITLENVGGDAWVPHYYYMIPRLIAGTYVFKVDITSSVSRDLRFNVILPKGGYASLLPNESVDFEVEKDVKYSFEAEFVIDETKDFVKFELDFGSLGDDFVSEAGIFILENISFIRK